MVVFSIIAIVYLEFKKDISRRLVWTMLDSLKIMNVKDAIVILNNSMRSYGEVLAHDMLYGNETPLGFFRDTLKLSEMIEISPCKDKFNSKKELATTIEKFKRINKRIYHASPHDFNRFMRSINIILNDTVKEKLNLKYVPAMVVGMLLVEALGYLSGVTNRLIIKPRIIKVIGWSTSLTFVLRIVGTLKLRYQLKKEMRDMKRKTYTQDRDYRSR